MNRFLLLPLLFCMSGFAQQPAEKPAIAYSRNGVLHITTASGKILQTVKTKVPIGNFAITPDASKILFIPLDSKSDGGNLYLLTVNTGNLKRLTYGPYFIKRNRDEVYADPDFSPNGEEAVFAIHAGTAGDAWETSGPAAIINLKTQTVKLISSTENVDGNGPAYANEPRWSPDGSKIIINFEDGSGLTSPKGSVLQDISQDMKGGDWKFSLGWLGSECLTYIAGKDPQDAEHNPAHVVNLKTKTIDSLAHTLNIPEESSKNIIAASPSIQVRRNSKNLVIEGKNSIWTIPYDNRTTFIKLLKQETGPGSCK